MSLNFNDIYPLLILGAIIGTFSVVFIVAYATMKNKKSYEGQRDSRKAS